MGNVNVEQGVMMAACAAPSMAGGMDASAHARRLGAKMSTRNAGQYGLESCCDDEMSMQQYASGDANLEQYAAEAPGVDTEDVGDFCVFSCKEPITILARKSAVVPMFSVPLKHAGVVLLYKESNHARRPFRAIKFKNETEYSLGRGKTVIYNQGVFSGECVLDSTKPGENRMLPHCLENGVKIVKTKSESTSRRSSINISEGTAVVEQLQTGLTEYTVENKKDEAFKVALEHVNRVHGGNVMVDFVGTEDRCDECVNVEIAEREKLDNGYRVYFEVQPNQTFTLKVTESNLDRQTTILGSRFDWVMRNIIDVENPLTENKEIQECIEIQKKIDETNSDRERLINRKRELNDQVDRVRSNLEAAQSVASGGKLDKWIDDLDSSEVEIREIDQTKVPECDNRHRTLSNELAEALQKVTASWREAK
jgi:hypothetical protein